MRVKAASEADDKLSRWHVPHSSYHRQLPPSIMSVCLSVCMDRLKVTVFQVHCLQYYFYRQLPCYCACLSHDILSFPVSQQQLSSMSANEHLCHLFDVLKKDPM